MIQRALGGVSGGLNKGREDLQKFQIQVNVYVEQ